jgi:hypothetical protein
MNGFAWFAWGIGVASFVAMLIMASNRPPNQYLPPPQYLPQLYGGMEPQSDLRAGLVLLVIVAILVVVIAAAVIGLG